MFVALLCVSVVAVLMGKCHSIVFRVHNLRWDTNIAGLEMLTLNCGRKNLSATIEVTCMHVNVPQTAKNVICVCTL